MSERTGNPGERTFPLRAGMVLGLIVAFGAGVPLPAVGSGDRLLEDFRAVVSLCRSNGLSVDSAAVRHEVAAALIRALDPGARLFSEEEMAEFEAERAGMASRVGLRFSMINGEPTITAVLDPELESCAAATGTVIAAVDEYTTAGLYHTDLVHLLSCTGSAVRLTLRYPDGTVTDCLARCYQMPLSSVEVVEPLPRDMVYIKVNGLFADGERLCEELRAASTGTVAGLVLDLRDAGGTNVAAAVRVASLFVPAGTQLFEEQRPDGARISTINAVTGASVRLPTMVLVNEGTRGAAELLAGMLSASGRQVMLIGRCTAADPCVRDIRRLPDGTYAYLLVRRIVLGDGSVLDGRSGIEPQIVIEEAAEPQLARTHQPLPPDTPEDEKAAIKLRERLEGDPVLERAVDMILGLKALGIR